MGGKGRVKDLVEKLNGHSNSDTKKPLECPKLPHLQELKSHSQTKHDAKIIEIHDDDSDVSNAHKRIQETTKIPNLKTTTKTTKHETRNNDSKAGINTTNEHKYDPATSDIEDNSDDAWIKLIGADNLYRILSDKHKALQKAHCRLKKKCAEEESKRIAIENELKNTKSNNKHEKDTTEQMRHLQEKENRLLTEVQELREQNELLEFRLLELEYYNNNSKTETSTIEEITERDDISDSGVMSLSPYEDFFSECDLQDIKLEDEEPHVTGNEVQQKLNRMFQCAENTSDKVTLQQAIDLIKHYQMRITGMEATLTNMCQERINQHSEEFLTSLKNPDECQRSKSTRVIATVPPFTNQPAKCYSPAESNSQEVPSEKLFLDIDRLQESGIFDEFLEHDLIERKSKETQTEYLVPSECTSSSVGSGSSGLVDELNKLEKIRQRIQERSSQISTSEKDFTNTKPVPSFNPKELSYYKKQYEILKSKLSAYETSGDSKIKQLANRLHKENELENRVQYLTNQISKLEADMKKLEEEKCEYEEAENDTRLRCQKLEVKLYALAEKKNDLQFQLQQHIRIVSNLRNTLTELEKKKEEAYEKSYHMEMTVNDLEERNFELEEREMDIRFRLQVLESVIPALIVWNMYVCLKFFEKYLNSHRLVPSNALPQPTTDTSPSSVPNNKLENQNDQLRNYVRKLERDLLDKENVIEKLKDYESELRTRIFELEEKVKYLKSNQNTAWYKAPKTNSRMHELELKEEVYVQTLQQADEMITDMENNFKKKLLEMENALTDKGWKLEECERKLAAVSLAREMETHLLDKVHNLETEIILLKQVIRSKEEEKYAWLENEKCLKEELENLNASLMLIKQNEQDVKSKLEQVRNTAKEQKEELVYKEKLMHDTENNYTNQIKQLEKRIQRLTREIENHEVTNSELKEEVDTLEGAICELNLTLDHEKDEKEKMLVKFRQELAMKQQEIDSLKRLSQDMTAISTAQEISLLQNDNKPKSGPILPNKYCGTLPKIIGASEKHEHNKNDAVRLQNNKYKYMAGKNNGKSESSAHVIRHKDRYTILLKPLPVENYSNFEISVNNNQTTTSNLRNAKLLGNIMKNDTISLTVKPI
ncbi:uncharacterized protein LOC135846792 isoform X2 [Planococcus citri]